MEKLKALLQKYPQDTVITVKMLFDMIEFVEREERKSRQDAYNHEKFLSQLQAECTDPNS